ncbi:hypothetical protein GCM10010398_48450 [Streptomyces fimbriatus]
MIPRRCVTAAAVVLTAACALVPVPATAASARPLGDFTVHRYDGLVAAPGELRVRHVEDLAEIPATQAGPDTDRLGRDAWARQRCATAARDSEVRVDGRAVPLPGSDVPETSLSRGLTRCPQELLSSPAGTTTGALRDRGPTHRHPHDDGHGHHHSRDDGPGRPHPHGTTHTHGGRTHTHPAAPTPRGTILLGFAGGLVPSPSAVVVLVGAAALGRAWFGLLLVVAYGAGPALVLTRGRVRGRQGGQRGEPAPGPAPPPDNGPVGGAGAPERAPGIGVRRRPGGRIGVQGGGIRTRLSYFRGERENSPGCEWGAPCPRNRAVSG